jgi:hypothetical protein
MAYTIMYFFEEDADRVDEFLLTDIVRTYGDCKVKSVQIDTKIEAVGTDGDNSIVSFCELELVCDTVESFDMVIGQIERRYGIVPYKTGYGES